MTRDVGAQRRWSLGALFRGGPTREQQLIELLAGDPEPLVAGWARAQRGEVVDAKDLLRALEGLRAEGDPVARSLAATVWLAWRDFQT